MAALSQLLVVQSIQALRHSRWAAGQAMLQVLQLQTAAAVSAADGADGALLPPAVQQRDQPWRLHRSRSSSVAVGDNGGGGRECSSWCCDQRQRQEQQQQVLAAATLPLAWRRQHAWRQQQPPPLWGHHQVQRRGASTSSSTAGDPSPPQQQPQQPSQQQEEEEQPRPPPTWVDTLLPPAARPYAQLMRLDKPIGTWLLLWPGLWAIAMAAPPGHLPDLHLCALFAAGAAVMRGAGCTVNDLWDRDIDRRVARTRLRPLAAGSVTVPAALLFLTVQLGAGLAVLLQLDASAQALGVASLALVGVYPLMKRVTWWPQAFLGLAMNYGVLMGYAAAAAAPASAAAAAAAAGAAAAPSGGGGGLGAVLAGGVPASAFAGDALAALAALDWSAALPMYLAGVAWTLVYDTIYAHQDKRDDAAVGVRSTALLFGARTTPACAAFAALQAAGLAAAGAAAGLGAPFYAAVAAGAAHQAWQLATVDLDDGASCAARFASNRDYGAIIFAGAVAGRLLS